MVFNQDLILKNNPPAWFWVLVFLVSYSSLFYLGLTPELIETQWPWVLAIYNGTMSLLALYFIVLNAKKLKQDSDSNVIGSNFTWSFIKIVPMLTLVPVFTFYMFSFQSIQDNLKRSEQGLNQFNKEIVTHVDGLYQDMDNVRINNYTDHTIDLFRLISSFSSFQKDSEEYKPQMQAVLEKLVTDGWACQLSLFDKEDELIAETKKTEQCYPVSEEPLPANQTFIFYENDTTNTVQVKLSTRTLTRRPVTDYIFLSGVYLSDVPLTALLNRMNNFRKSVKNVKLKLSTTIIQTRFLIDFSSTILLTILSALLIVFRMMDQLMRPMNNLTVAAKEIAQGNYDVVVHNQEESEDMCQLIGQFNEMSKQIRHSRQGLDTHNLYLETILKYSYGVIGLDQARNIRLINPMIGKMLSVDNEQQFIGELCKKIADQNIHLQSLFAMIEAKFKNNEYEWSEEIELSLPGRHVLLTCQGAALDVSDETLGYVIIIKDISKLNRAQKKAAWGEVAVRMAHEIKNPLTPILLSAQRLRNKFLETLSGKDLEVIDKTTTVIIDQVRSMDAMVSAFADYANIPQIERKLTDLNSLINQYVALYDAQKNITIDLDLSGDVPKILLDANSISRVLINLVKNATESAEDGQNLIVNITTQYLVSEGIVRLSVQDNGEGFDEAVIERIFEPYVTTKVKGSGLGMAIVQNIIEQHNGRVFAGNVEPHGAIVTIEFDQPQPQENI